MMGADLIRSFDITCSATQYSIILLLLTLLLVSFQRWRNERLLPPSPVSLPVIGHLHLLGPLVHQSLCSISVRYGPFFSLKLGSLLCVVATSPEVARELLKGNELTFSSRRQSIAIKRLTHDSALAFVPYGPYWKFINKLVMTNLLNPRALAQFYPIRTREVHHFINVLLEHNSPTSGRSGVVNVTHELLKLTSNVISHMMFGVNRRADEARGLVREVTLIFGEFNVADFIWLGKGLDLVLGYNRRVDNIHKRYDSLLESIITDREDLRKSKSNINDVRDFLDILLDAMGDEDSEIKVTRSVIKALILDFLTAATDTSAISIEWTLVELINNPRVLTKAEEELDRVVGRDRLVQETDLANLPYIQAIIKETYRLHPPVPMLIRESTKECEVNGYGIPKNTLLFVNNWAMGRDPKIWDSPMEYKPERHSDSGGGGLMEMKGQNFQMLPFGYGRRGCPGSNLALQLVPTTVAALVQCFNWNSVNTGLGVLDTKERPGMTAPRAQDLTCVPVPRFHLPKIVQN